MSDYPEHNKLRGVQSQSQACGGFLDWLFGEKHVHLQVWSDKRTVDCWWCDSPIELLARAGERAGKCPVCKGTKEVTQEGFVPLNFTLNGLLAEYFEIDEGKIENERRAMLDALRAANP